MKAADLLRGVDFPWTERLLRVLIYLGQHLPEVDRPGWWIGSWQEKIFGTLLNYRKVILQGPRQATGKSYLAALLAVIYILLGFRVVVAMPSLRQGSRILLRRIKRWMEVLEPQFGLKRIKDDELEVEWQNGGGLMALSTNEAAGKGAQGYTCALLLIDEGHEAPQDMFGIYRALVKVAMRAGYGKIVILGVGGPADSLIEFQKTTGEYELEFWNDEKIIALDPSWDAEFKADLAELSPEDYDKFNRCLPVRAGGRLVFGALPEKINLNAILTVKLMPPPHWVLAMDVGKRVDETVLYASRVRGTMLQVEQVFRWRGTDYVKQVDEIEDVVGRFPHAMHDLGVEVNGPGEPVADIMEARASLRGLTRIYTTDNKPIFQKSLWIKDLQKCARYGHIAVADPTARGTLEKLSYEIKDDGRYDWPHDDDLSALWLTKALTFRAVGV